VVLFVAVQPAIFEELAFRGVIINALQRALSPFETVIVSALMFMILHLSFGRFPHTLALGLAAGFLRVRTKSLYPCMILHFSHNFMCVMAERAGWTI
jgi:membrane protease YdiL (CAAX protease family)